MNTTTRRFSNLTDSTVYVVQVNGDEGCYFLTNDAGEVCTYTSYTDAFEVLENVQDGGEYGELQRFEPGETIDMDGEGCEDDCEQDDE